MNEVKLKPCPFCGGEAEIIDQYNWHLERCEYCVICSGVLDCIIFATSERRFSTKEEAIKVWNTRYEPPTPGGAIVPGWK